jgi:starch synthase
MKVLYISPEVVPFAKTGGLADVAGALPQALSARGHDVRVAMPYFRSVRASGSDVRRRDATISAPVGDQMVHGGLLAGALPSGTQVLFLDQPGYFDRDGFYGDASGDYKDNCARFVWFCRAALEAAKHIGFAPDIIHANDWQTALAPVFARLVYGGDPAIRNAATLLTVHNIAYQGVFSHWEMPLTGLAWSHFNWREFEFYGKLNLLKAGLVHSDGINTVSPTYAREIRLNETMGAGLDGVLRHRQDALWGIVNGIDGKEWDPATDALIPARFTVDDLAGKARCKAALQSELGLPQEAKTPVIGMVLRLDPQKGMDLVMEGLPEMMAKGVQMAILGAGHERYHKALEETAKKYPRQVGVRLKYDNGLAHRIEAGADMFLMPSRFEPCGLNQLYSLRYGTVPIVRATGGLVDTITDASREGLRSGKANGFNFGTFTSPAMMTAVDRALGAYRDGKAWTKIVRTGMKQDWSWGNSAREYEGLYMELIQRRKSGAQGQGGDL